MTDWPVTFEADGPRWAIATPHTAATAAGRGGVRARRHRDRRRGPRRRHARGRLPPHVRRRRRSVRPGPARRRRYHRDLLERAEPRRRRPRRARRRPGDADPGPVPDHRSRRGRGLERPARPGRTAPLARRVRGRDRRSPNAASPVSRSLARALRRAGAPVRDDPGLASIFYPGGEPASAGSAVVQPALARTLAGASRRDGPAALYGGETRPRVRGRARAPPVRRSRSTISRAHDAPRSAPAPHGASATCTSRVRRRTPRGSCCSRSSRCSIASGSTPIWTAPDAGRIARIFDGGRRRPRPSPRRSGPHAHRTHRRCSTTATSPVSPTRRTRRATARRRLANAAAHADGDTIALVTADAEGNAVSLIQSLFWGFGSGILEPDTGIVAQNRGACFTLEPGHPNRFAPGVRPLHTLMPVLVHDERGLAAVAGTDGRLPAAADQPAHHHADVPRRAPPRRRGRRAAVGRARSRRPSPPARSGVEPGVPAPRRATALAAPPATASAEADGFGHAHLIRVHCRWVRRRIGPARRRLAAAG